MDSDQDNLHCPCFDNTEYKNTKLSEKCSICNTYQHKECIKALSKMKGYICPSCQIKTGALFYNILFSILEPNLFQVCSPKLNTKKFYFTPDFADYQGCSDTCKIRQDNPVCILIRSLKFEEKGFSFHWPKQSKIFLNKKIILDLTQKGFKKQDRAIALIFSKDNDKDVAKNFYLYDSHIFPMEEYLIDKRPNYLRVQVDYEGKEMEEKSNFAISIDFSEVLKDTEEIKKKIPTISNKSIIKELLINNDRDKILKISNETVSLIDIYSEEKIELPARGRNCSHLNVFDLESFLLLNRKSNKYICQYCNTLANDLYIDGNILHFMQQKENADVEEISIDKNLNIVPIFDKKPVSINENEDDSSENIDMKENESSNNNKDDSSNNNINSNNIMDLELREKDNRKEEVVLSNNMSISQRSDQNNSNISASNSNNSNNNNRNKRNDNRINNNRDDDDDIEMNDEVISLS